MKLWRLLTLPWYGWQSSTRQVVAAFSAALLLNCILVVLCTYPYGAHWTAAAAASWARGCAHGGALLDALLWALLLPNNLLLTHAACHLRMPHVQRESRLSLSVYALLSIGLPAALLGLAGGPTAVIAVELLLGAGVGMSYAVLPRYLSFFLLFVALLHDVLEHWLALPSDTQPGFLLPTALLAAALWSIVGWRWRRLSRDEAALGGVRAPMLWVFRLASWRRGGNLGPSIADTGRQLRQLPDWLRPKVDLRGIGPGHAVSSLRVALGNSFMPLTVASRARQFILLLLVVSGVAGLLVLQASGYGSDAGDHAPPFGHANTLLWVAPSVGAAMAWGLERTLRLRWSRWNAELPLLALLALLPGLDRPAQVKSDLLLASLLPVLSLQGLLLLASIVLAVWWHLAGGSDLLLLLIGQVAGMGLSLALALAVFGGHLAARWRRHRAASGRRHLVHCAGHFCGNPRQHRTGPRDREPARDRLGDFRPGAVVAGSSRLARAATAVPSVSGELRRRYAMEYDTAVAE